MVPRGRNEAKITNPRRFLVGPIENRCILSVFDPPKVKKVAFRGVKLQLVGPKTSNIVFNRVEHCSGNILKPKLWYWTNKIDL